MVEPTISEANWWLSIKKHFIDNIQVAHVKNMKFGSGFSQIPDEWTQWISVSYGRGAVGSRLSSMILNIFPCTRFDPEGDELAKLTDLVIEHITDYAKTGQTNSAMSIPFYDTAINPWAQISAIMFDNIPERGEIIVAEDNTTFRILVTTTNFFSK